VEDVSTVGKSAPSLSGERIGQTIWNRRIENKGVNEAAITRFQR